MKPSGSAVAALERLRATLGVAAAVDDRAHTGLFEAWAKRPTWRLASEAIPLLVGVDPEAWAASLGDPVLRECARVLTEALAEVLAQDPAADCPLSPPQLVRASDRLALGLPPALGTLLAFMARALPVASTDPATDSGPALQLAEDRLVILGAALALVTREPQACLDGQGCFSAHRIAERIFRQAVYWFPLGPPSCPLPDAVALIARWLPATATTG